MNMQQCPNGHFYDMARNTQCPYCTPEQRTTPFPANSPSVFDPHNCTTGERAAHGNVFPKNDYDVGGPTLQMCPNGHFYDPHKYAQCPLCAQGQQSRVVPTPPVVSPFPPDPPPAPDPHHDRAGLGFKPTVGWLVCVDGPMRGNDYSLKSGDNNIGRGGEGARVDIQIVRDPDILQSGMAYVAYDSLTASFYAYAGPGPSPVHVNGEHLPEGQRRKLQAYDRIKLGWTTLAFAPFCGEGFDWLDGGEYTQPSGADQGFDEGAERFDAPAQPAADVGGATVPIFIARDRIDPVAGWLVCVEGKARGRDYRIKSGNNSIGRGGGAESVDIRILGDECIAKSDQAYIAYDDRCNSFYATAGPRRNIVRVNNMLLPAGSSRELHAGDRIRLGETTLVFVPFCGEAFDWAWL